MLGPSLPRRQSLPSGPLHARLAADLLALHPHPCSLPQAANLIKAGYDVTVWNRSADKCAALQAAGAKVCLGSGARQFDLAVGAVQLQAACWTHQPLCLVLTMHMCVAARPCAQVAGTPAEVVSACDITLAMLSDPEACLAVAKGAVVLLGAVRGG